MYILFVLLWLISVVMMILATVKPKYAIIPFAKNSRIKAFFTWFGIGVICLIIIGATMPDDIETTDNSDASSIDMDQKDTVDTESENEAEMGAEEPLDSEATVETSTEVEAEGEILALDIHNYDDKNVVGDIVLVGDMGVQVLGTQLYAGDEFDIPSSGYEFIVVYVSLINWGTDTISYDSWDFQLSDSNGVLDYEALVVFDADTYLGGAELLPGGYAEGTIVFEKPIGDQNVLLHYEPMFSFSGDSTVIDLAFIRDEYYLLKDLK